MTKNRILVADAGNTKMAAAMPSSTTTMMAAVAVAVAVAALVAGMCTKEVKSSYDNNIVCGVAIIEPLSSSSSSGSGSSL